MTKRLVDIDDDKLVLARELLGTSTIKGTVDRALDEAIALERRRSLLDALRDPEIFAIHDDPDAARRDAWR